ncbi:MAG: hypothetical protein ABIJ53_02535 [Verrucomicrobiota bacterium]
MSTLLHGLLVLGAVWFWTLRSPEIQPMFQRGDVSLAVTFVAADEGNRRSETTDILTDPETEMLEDGLPTVAPEAKVGRQTIEEEGEDQAVLDAETTMPVFAQASANAPEDGRQTTDDRGRTQPPSRRPLRSARV